MNKKICFLLVFFIGLLKSNNFVLISAPGSGKGTFSQYFVHNFDYVQICPGDLFRQEILNQTDLGKQIQPIVDSGQYVDESIVCSIIQEHLKKALSQNKKFILDGFPRSQHSLQFLLKFFEENNVASEITYLQFVCSDEKCLHRISGRMVCNQCAFVYHKDFLDIKKMTCQNCNSVLSRRSADTETIARNRLKYFHDNIEILLNDVEQKKLLIIKINTEKSLDSLKDIYAKLL